MKYWRHEYETHQFITTEQSVPAGQNPRGRPPKPRFTYKAAIAKLLTQSETAALQKMIHNLDCVRVLPPRTKFQLVEIAEQIVIDVRLMAELRNRPQSGKGNKTKPHISFALYQCAAAWCHANQLKSVSLWENRYARQGTTESPPVQFTRVVLHIAFGKPYTQTLRRQYGHGIRWESLPIAQLPEYLWPNYVA